METFEKVYNMPSFFLKCLVEFTRETIRAWRFLYGMVLHNRFTVFNRYGAPESLFLSVLVLVRSVCVCVCV